jgi:hypothetical protein
VRLPRTPSNDNDSTTVVQNDDDSPNTGQQGTGTQVDNSTVVEIGDDSNFVAAPDDVAVGSVAAQAPNSLAVGGSAASINGDAIVGLDGAVDNGALADGGGIALGEDVDIDDAFAAVGLDGVAVAAQDEIVQDGAALVIGDGNTTAVGHNDAAVVGFNGNAIYIDDADDNMVIGFGNVVAMTELDQEYSAPVIAGPSQDSFVIVEILAGDLTVEGEGSSFVVRDADGNPHEVSGDGDIITNNAVGTIQTGHVGNLSASAVAGINDMFFSTGVGNQGHIGSVSANVGSVTF